MPHRLIDNNCFADSLVQYGDGVFETMLVVERAIVHAEYHWRRLLVSCERLAISPPDIALLTEQLNAGIMSSETDVLLIKLIVSRGSALRGYGSRDNQPCDVQFAIRAYEFNSEIYQHGLSLQVAKPRIASQPLLAGMKHCNRLEYVMIKRQTTAEWQQAPNNDFDEIILVDEDEQVIETLISNIFIIDQRRLLTPQLDRAGVAGTMRAYLFDRLRCYGYTIEAGRIGLDELLKASAVFLSNALRGVVPVAFIRDQHGSNHSFDMVPVRSIRQIVEHPCSVL